DRDRGGVEARVPVERCEHAAREVRGCLARVWVRHRHLMRATGSALIDQDQVVVVVEAREDDRRLGQSAVVTPPGPPAMKKTGGPVGPGSRAGLTATKRSILRPPFRVGSSA